MSLAVTIAAHYDLAEKAGWRAKAANAEVIVVILGGAESYWSPFSLIPLAEMPVRKGLILLRVFDGAGTHDQVLEEQAVKIVTDREAAQC